MRLPPVPGYPGSKKCSRFRNFLGLLRTRAIGAIRRRESQPDPVNWVYFRVFERKRRQARARPRLKMKDRYEPPQPPTLRLANALHAAYGVADCYSDLIVVSSAVAHPRVQAQSRRQSVSADEQDAPAPYGSAGGAFYCPCGDSQATLSRLLAITSLVAPTRRYH